MELKATGKVILNQLAELTSQLTDLEYSTHLDLLHGNSIGKHVRHVLEFFDILVVGANSGRINYDGRKHQLLLETCRQSALSKLVELSSALSEVVCERKVTLEVSYSDTEEDVQHIGSTLERELAYNIEHAIHHMAIIKIAIQTAYPSVLLNEHFGVAYSTIRYQKSIATEL